MTTVFGDQDEAERPAGDVGSAAARIQLALHGLTADEQLEALITATTRIGGLAVFRTCSPRTPPVDRVVVASKSAFERPEGGHVSGILARVVDLLAQCSGNAERRQVLNGVAAFHGLTDRPED